MSGNFYVDLQAFSDDQNGGKPFDQGDARAIMKHLEDASRQVDLDCRRSFYVQTAAKQSRAPLYRPAPAQRLGDVMLLGVPVAPPFYTLPDLISPTLVQYDAAGDLSFNQILVRNTDYSLRQSGAPLLPGQLSMADPPYDRMDLLFSMGQFTGSPFGPQGRGLTAMITGTWGYTTGETEPVAGGITVSLADAVTSVMTSSAPSDLAPGQTLLVEAEQLFILGGTSTGTAWPDSPWTVLRGMNGTTPAAHATKPAQRQRYPAGVVEATLIEASRLWSRRRSAYANAIVAPGMGTISTFKGLDPDYDRRIQQFRRNVE